MPNRDGAGPNGKGAKTGRGLGRCGDGTPRGEGRGRNDAKNRTNDIEEAKEKKQD